MARARFTRIGSALNGPGPLEVKPDGRRPTPDRAPRPGVAGGPVPFADLGLQGRKVLMLASSGGHTTQLAAVASGLDLHTDSLFVTFPGVQAEDLRRDFRILEVPYIPPRGLREAAAIRGPLRSVLRAERFDAAISTGSAIAVPGLLTARAHGVRAMYVESFTRQERPSLTGSLLARSRSVEMFAQHQLWPSPWRFAGSVLDTLGDRLIDSAPAAPARRVFVTLGTIRPYRFDALIDRVLALLPSDVDVTWQVGSTARTDLPGEVFETMSATAFEQCVRTSDVVVSHGGTGTILTMLQHGRKPLLVPRIAARGEHVDDHQLSVCEDFARRGLADIRRVEELSADDFGWSVQAA